METAPRCVPSSPAGAGGRFKDRIRSLGPGAAEVASGSELRSERPRTCFSFQVYLVFFLKSVFRLIPGSSPSFLTGCDSGSYTTCHGAFRQVTGTFGGTLSFLNLDRVDFHPTQKKVCGEGKGL